MRKPEDGDIKPTKEEMQAAYDVLAKIVELIGDDDEDATDLKNDMEMLKKRLRRNNNVNYCNNINYINYSIAIDITY